MKNQNVKNVEDLVINHQKDGKMILLKIQKEEMIVVTEVEIEAGVIEIKTEAETEIAMGVMLGVIEAVEIVLEKEVEIEVTNVKIVIKEKVEFHQEAVVEMIISGAEEEREEIKIRTLPVEMINLINVVVE